MDLEPYQRVALTGDLEEHGLREGDVATLIGRAPHPGGGEEGYVLEVCNAVGASVAAIVVKASDVEPLRDDELLSVRQVAGVV